MPELTNEELLREEIEGDLLLEIKWQEWDDDIDIWNPIEEE